MHLNKTEKQALTRGEAVPLDIDGIECVVLRRDIYDNVGRILSYNDGRWTEEEKKQVLRHIGQRAGWDDPELDVYEEYRKQILERKI